MSGGLGDNGELLITDDIHRRHQPLIFKALLQLI
jgi:hypothetical protein